MYVSGDTCKNSDSVAAITDPTSTNEGTLPSRTYSCAKWGRTCITCEDGVKFAGDFDSSLTTSPQSCSTCNACDRAGQQTDDTCTSASDATCECQVILKQTLSSGEFKKREHPSSPFNSLLYIFSLGSSAML